VPGSKPQPQHCPAGTFGTFPNCTKIGSGGINTSKSGEPKAQPGNTKKRPDCPAGTVGIWPRCQKQVKPPPAPKQVPKPPPPKQVPKPAPKPKGCPSGLTGPRCDQIIVR